MPTAVSTRAVTDDAPAPTPLPPRDVGLNLQQRMLLVMHRVGYIPKTGTGPREQGSYRFAESGVVKDRVREECVAAGVMIHTSLSGRDIQIIEGVSNDGKPRRSVLATVWGTLTFVNVDDPADILVDDILGQGIDTQDKALAKAMTQAVKNGLINAFSIPTGDDPDAEGHDLPAVQSRSRPVQQRSAPRTAPAGVPDEAPWPEGAGAPTGDLGKCPKHRRDWKNGQYGWYCSSQDPDTQRGYCIEKPADAWVAVQER